MFTCRQCFALPLSSLRFGPSRTTVHRTVWTLVTSSLGRGRVRIIRNFRKQTSKISSMLTLPARTLPARTLPARKKIPCMFPCKGRINSAVPPNFPNQSTRTLICLTRTTFRTTLCLVSESKASFENLTPHKFGTNSSGGKFDISFELKEAFSR